METVSLFRVEGVSDLSFTISHGRDAPSSARSVPVSWPRWFLLGGLGRLFHCPPVSHVWSPNPAELYILIRVSTLALQDILAALGRFTRARESCLHHRELFRLGPSILCLSLSCASLGNPPQQRSSTRRLEAPTLFRFTGRTLGSVLISAQERVKLPAALGWCLAVPGAEARRACSCSGGGTRHAGLCVPAVRQLEGSRWLLYHPRRPGFLGRTWRTCTFPSRAPCPDTPCPHLPALQKGVGVLNGCISQPRQGFLQIPCSAVRASCCHQSSAVAQ